MNQKKIYCSISGHLLNNSIKEDKLNYQTYEKLLDYFDEVHIFARSYERDDVEVYNNIYFHYNKVPNNNSLKYFLSIIKIIKNVKKEHNNYRFSLLDASEPTTGGVVGIILKKLLKIPLIIQVQGELTRIPSSTVGVVKSNGFKFLTLLSCKNADKIRVVSDSVKFQLIEDGIEKNKIEVITPRVKLENFNFKLFNGTSNEIRVKYNISQKKQILLFVGRLVIFKGVKYLFEALSKIDKDKYHLLIIGDGELKDDLVKLSLELNLSANVTFIGKVDFNLIPYYMSSCDIFILSSLDEGFGRVLIEAMAMKKIVISTKVGGTKDIIVDGESGFFMEKVNIESFVKTINKVLNLDELQKKLIIEKAYVNVTQKYEFNASMNKFINFYDSVVINENS